MTIYLPQLSANDVIFPPIDQALGDPDGLLAMGGDLSCERLINAYRQAIFPWFSEGQPILWWSPKQRSTMNANLCHISKSMKRCIRKKAHKISINHNFEDVIRYCAQPRAEQAETWITDAMISAYLALHEIGVAHSVEVWDETNKLVGGLYGINIGRVFCGESMFSLASNTSKLAFIALNQHFKKHGGELIDCQMLTEHLKSLGVTPTIREHFQKQLINCRDEKIDSKCWDQQVIAIQLS